MSVTIIKLITTVLNTSGLPSLNLTLESDSQITTRVTALKLPTHSNSLVLVIRQLQIDVINTENTIITTPGFKTSSVITSPLIKRLKKLKKVIKSKGYYILKEGEELNISKRIL